MSTIQFGGVVSGLNTQSIIDALMGVKKQPLTQLQSKEADLTSQQTAYSQLGSALDDLITKVKNFTVSSAGAARTASSTNTSLFTASASTNAAVAQYAISVDRLATTTRASSLGALGSAVSLTTDTSQFMANLPLATAITKGNMALTVDGTTVQVAVGDPASTTLQSTLDSLASALQTQLNAGGDTAAVSASIVGGHVQLAISGETQAHDISFGDAVNDTSNLATALGLSTQGVTGSQNANVTGSSFMDPVLASLNLPGSITAGQISAIVDGQIVHYTVGDPTKTTLTQLMQGFSAAIQTQLQSGGANAAADPTATVSMNIVNNQMQLSIAGAGATHSLWFGAAGDASNALGILGIGNLSATNATNPTLAATTNLGVVRLNSSLDTAGLTGLTSTKTGTLTINGVAISYDTTKDTLSNLITRINSSAAGVVASVDRNTDKLLISRKDTGATAIDIQDTGTIATALKLAPGTTNAQTIGQSAQIEVDGRTIVSSSNQVTNAIDGVTINLVGQSTNGATGTLTIGTDANAVASSINQFITSFNAVGDLLDKLTAQTPGTSGGTAGTSGPLSSDPSAQTMFLELRDTLMQAVGSTAVNSMGALGLSTGAIGAAPGSTTRLQLDTSQLQTALNTDANSVASLLDSTSGPMANLLTQLTAYEDPSSTTTYVQAHTAGLASDISSIKRQEDDQTEMINNYQAMLEAQYATMEATLAQLQSQSAQVAATLGYSSSSSSGSGVSNSSSS